MFRIMDLDGKVSKANKALVAEEPLLQDKQTLRKVLESMIKCNSMDGFLNTAQRQGRISFYMTSVGEEGCIMGIAAALADNDWIFPQYREHGILVYRGQTYAEFVAQCYGAYNCQIKSRQMPVHYGNNEKYYMNTSSPLCTQVPHASGAGYALKLDGADNIAVAFNGEGSSSQGDFYSGILFASRTKSHTLFAIRNNGYAISTPITDQYDGDGVAPRAIALNIPTIRVDGNDVLAVMYATKKARNLIMQEHTPVLVEYMTYRVGNHSTSDSPTYRTKEEVDWWNDARSPINRFKKYCIAENLVTQAEVDEWSHNYLESIKKELTLVSTAKRPGLHTLFEDIHLHKDKNSIAQEMELKQHLHKYGEHYGLEKFDGGL